MAKFIITSAAVTTFGSYTKDFWGLKCVFEAFTFSFF